MATLDLDQLKDLGGVEEDDPIIDNSAILATPDPGESFVVESLDGEGQQVAPTDEQVVASDYRSATSMAGESASIVSEPVVAQAQATQTDPAVTVDMGQAVSESMSTTFETAAPVGTPVADENQVVEDVNTFMPSPTETTVTLPEEPNSAVALDPMMVDPIMETGAVPAPPTEILDAAPTLDPMAAMTPEMAAAASLDPMMTQGTVIPEAQAVPLADQSVMAETTPENTANVDAVAAKPKTGLLGKFHFAKPVKSDVNTPVPATAAPSAGGLNRVSKYGLCVLGVLVIAALVLSGVVWYRGRHGQVSPTGDEAPKGNSLAAGTCQPPVDGVLRATIDDFARMIQGEGYEDMTITPQMKEDFDFFQKYALSTSDGHCFALQYCREDFATDVPFALAFARRAYVAKHYGDDGSSHAGQWQAASTLRADVTEYFGITNPDMGQYPVRGGTINDVYNSLDDTFLVADDLQIAGPYHYQLREVRANEATGQRVYVASTVFDQEECTVSVGETKCPCVQANYYLVQEVNPADQHLIWAREYVQVVDETRK